jgi:AcrR family transcriptional regulator
MPTLGSPRDRLIYTAGRLFYDRGLPNVGINEVTEKAGVARMTLYNNFASKEALALAAFEKQSEQRRVLIEKHLKRVQTAGERICAMFDVAERLASEPRFRGCAFINVAAQEPEPKTRMHALVRNHKNWLRGIFRDNAEQAGHRNPDLAGQQLLALWDGALVQAFIQGSVEPIRASREAARLLIPAGA